MTASLTNSSDIDNACSVIQDANRNQRHICNIPRSKGALNQGQQRLAHSRNTEENIKNYWKKALKYWAILKIQVSSESRPEEAFSPEIVGRNISATPDYFKCVHCKGKALFLWELSRSYVADQEGWEHCTSFKILSDDDEKKLTYNDQEGKSMMTKMLI